MMLGRWKKETHSRVLVLSLAKNCILHNPYNFNVHIVYISILLLSASRFQDNISCAYQAVSLSLLFIMRHNIKILMIHESQGIFYDTVKLPITECTVPFSEFDVISRFLRFINHKVDITIL